MIGFYDYTVILTLVSVASSLVGMMQAISGNCVNAVFFLALSGLLDGFDGKVARTKKDRTEDEKLYGIQLDSLADIVCFGVLPAVICFQLGMKTKMDTAILGFFLICGIIRLAFFNVLETNRQTNPDSGEKVYHGLPITTISMILPVAFFCCSGMGAAVLVKVLRILMPVVGIFFVMDFKLKKLKNWQFAILSLLVGAAVIYVLLHK